MAEKKQRTLHENLRLTLRNILILIAIGTLGSAFIDLSTALLIDERGIAHAVEASYPVGDLPSASSTLNAVKWQTDRFMYESPPNIAGVQTLVADPALQTPVAVAQQNVRRTEAKQKAIAGYEAKDPGRPFRNIGLAILGLASSLGAIFSHFSVPRPVRSGSKS